MIFEGCQGKPRTPTLAEKRCPRCGSLVEIFSVDTEAVCESCGCGQVIYNDALSCVQWCQYAKKCVGEEMYAHMMEIARQQKARARAEREAKRLAKEREALNP